MRKEINTRREFLKNISKSTMGLLGISAVQQGFNCTMPSPNKKPNFVFILIDDLGWTDLTGFGSSYYETPHIDRLASRGMKFTDAYAACTVCSPTRASILTGKYPARLHLTDWITGHERPYAQLRIPEWTQYLPHSEITIAEALHEAGYVSASIGKWHLGGREYYPDKHGFDINVAGTDRGQPPSYFYPYTNKRFDIETLHGGKEGEYLTDRMTDEAEAFIEQHQDNPFFLYLAHFAVHTPIQGKKELTEKYEAKTDPTGNHSNAEYAAMIQSVDESVGRIGKKLEDLELTGDTVIIFMSDNGGLTHLPVTSNIPLREGKGHLYEGGVRVPMIISYPGVVQPDTICDTPVISTDFYPTILDMAGISADPGHVIDGVSLKPLILQSGSFDREAIFWHYPHYHPGGATPYGAVRKGPYKLIEFYEDQHVELYNLREDIGETHDLSSSMPEKVHALRTLLQQWRTSVDAQMPDANPNYDPAKAHSGPQVNTKGDITK
jgi:arylsulfatase A